MDIKIGYDKDFTKLIKKLQQQYGKDIMNLEGIGEQLDTHNYGKKLFSTKVTADNSIDANANVSEVIPSTYVSEMPKPYIKLNSLYLLSVSILAKLLVKLKNTASLPVCFFPISRMSIPIIIYLTLHF